MNPKIIFQDDNILVINKPAGILVHDDGKNEGPTIVDWLNKNFPDLKDVGESATLSDGKVIARPGIVHRLDRDTSGVMIIAKTEEAFENLKEQFRNHEVRKVYHAFLYGHLRDDRGVVNEPIARSKVDFRRWTTGKNIRGESREAVTQFTVLARTKEWTYVVCRPKTGRTHQIRVHMKYLHHPVIADELYAPNQPKILGFERHALHAREIEFTGLDGKTLKFEAEFPEDFAKAIEIAKNNPLC